MPSSLYACADAIQAAAAPHSLSDQMDALMLNLVQQVVLMARATGTDVTDVVEVISRELLEAASLRAVGGSID